MPIDKKYANTKVHLIKAIDATLARRVANLSNSDLNDPKALAGLAKDHRRALVNAENMTKTDQLSADESSKIGANWIQYLGFNKNGQIELKLSGGSQVPQAVIFVHKNDKGEVIGSDFAILKNNQVVYRESSAHGLSAAKKITAQPQSTQGPAHVNLAQGKNRKEASKLEVPRAGTTEWAAAKDKLNEHIKDLRPTTIKGGRFNLSQSLAAELSTRQARAGMLTQNDKVQSLGTALNKLYVEGDANAMAIYAVICKEGGFPAFDKAAAKFRASDDFKLLAKAHEVAVSKMPPAQQEEFQRIYPVASAKFLESHKVTDVMSAVWLVVDAICFAWDKVVNKHAGTFAEYHADRDHERAAGKGIKTANEMSKSYASQVARKEHNRSASAGDLSNMDNIGLASSAFKSAAKDNAISELTQTVKAVLTEELSQSRMSVVSKAAIASITKDVVAALDASRSTNPQAIKDTMRHAIQHSCADKGLTLDKRDLATAVNATYSAAIGDVLALREAQADTKSHSARVSNARAADAGKDKGQSK